MLSIQPMIFDARIQKSAKVLRDKGYSVTTIYLEDQQFIDSVPNLEEAWSAYHEEMRGIDTRRWFLRSREWRWLPKTIHKLLQAIELLLKFSWAVTTHKADIYHCHDLQPGIFCIWGKILHRARIVYDAHELEVRAPRRLTRLMQASYERLLIACSDVVITVNEEIAGLMQRKYKRDIAVIANRPEYLPTESIRADLLRRSVRLPAQAKVIMYVGYVTPKARGIEQVVEALSFLDDDVIFLIMGVGRLNEFKSYLKDYIDQLPISADRVQFIGPFPPNKVAHYLSGAHISTALIQGSASTSYQLCAPNKLYESIMARTPILASNNGTFPKYVHENGVGSVGDVVDEQNSRLVAEKIKLMLESERQQLYRQNAEKLAKQVSWQAEAKKLLKLYEGLAR